MKTEPRAVSAVAARALLDSVREVKDSYSAVDAAVTNHLRTWRKPVRHPVLYRTGNACVLAGYTGTLAWIGGTIGEQVAGWARTVTLPGDVAVSPFMLTGVITLSAVAGIMEWDSSGYSLKVKAAAAAEERGDNFLFAGVALELALGDLQTALADAGRGQPGAAEALAHQGSVTQEALDHYVAALRQLDENDVSIRFPWSSRDIDVTIARELLALDVESVLARADLVTKGDLDTVALVAQPGAPAPVSSRATPTGGLSTLTTTAEVLGAELAESAEALQAIETQLQHVSQRPGGSIQLDDAALHRIAGEVTQAYMCAGLLEADCLTIGNAAQTAATESVSRALGYLTAVPAANLRLAFEGYQSGVVVALHEVAPVTDNVALVEIAATLRKLSSALPRLGGLAGTLATTLDAEPHDLRHRALS